MTTTANCSESVLLSVENHVATLTLNRAANRNAMTTEVLETFQGLIREIKSRDDVRVVVVQGSGKTFCSGADFKSIGGGNPLGNSISGDVGSGNAMEDKIRGIYSKFLAITELEVPTIAKVNGHAIGGGLGLALACDLRVVCKTVKLGVNFTKLGLSPGMATTYMLPRVVGLPRAAELFFTGDVIDAATMQEWGLVSRVVEPDALMDKARTLAEKVAAMPPAALHQTKMMLRQGRGLSYDGALELAASTQGLMHHTEDHAEGVAALIEKRAPDFRGE